MSKKSRRTFLQNVAAASLLALSDARAQVSSPSAGRPPIQFDFATDLDKDDIYKFLDSAAPTWDALPSSFPGFTQSTVSKKPVGSIDKYPESALPPLQGAPIRLWWAVQKRCKVFEGSGQGQLVGTPKVLIPKSCQVTIQVFAILFIKSDTAVTPVIKTKIETAFNNFQYPRDGDPLTFIQNAVVHDPTIKTDYFFVANTFSISKVSGTLESKNDLDAAATQLYAGQTPAMIWTGPNSREPLQGQNGFFATRHMRLVCGEKVDFLGRIPAPLSDPHKVELPQGQTEKQAVQQIARNDTPVQCSELTEKDWPILTLAVWPEFKVDWRDFTFYIGCGIRIVLTLPVLQIQISGVDLWVYTRYPNSWTPVLSTIQHCAFEAALSGAVIGVVLLDPIAGLGAFEAYFEGCITDHLTQTIECMVPGLGLVTSVKSRWHDVI
jgi:hypothetical protein